MEVNRKAGVGGVSTPIFRTVFRSRKLRRWGGECFPSLRLIVGDERMQNHLWRKLPDEKHIAKEYVFLALHIFIHL